MSREKKISTFPVQAEAFLNEMNLLNSMIIISGAVSEKYDSPNLASMYRAVTEVADFAEYTPSASRDRPPAVASILSQSCNRA